MDTPVEVITFGCRLNAYESEVIKKNSSDLKNTLIFNTCAVTSEAERQARQSIRKKSRLNPEARVIVTGCSAQIDSSKWSAMPEVDTVLGNKEKLSITNYNSDKPKVQVNDIMSVADTAGHLLQAFNSKSRAFLEIQNGCNHRCTFCIIPYARGNSRSVKMGDIISGIKSLTDSGYSEVVLTGVDIGDYGSDISEFTSLKVLIENILYSVPKLSRLRLSSIDPVKIDENLISLISQDRRIMPYFHLSIQSGDDLILKRMKRRHLRKDIIETCKRIRKLRPDSIFGADFIAGFPTENEEMFSNTLSLIHECEIAFLHIFPYSIRHGTPAALMPQVDNKIKKLRAKKLRDAGNIIKLQKYNEMLGKIVNVLVENENIGRTENFIPIKLNKNFENGKIISAKVLSLSDSHLYGEVR